MNYYPQLTNVYHRSRFNNLQYSDADSLAKLDNELREAQVAYENEIKKKEEYQEQLERQNSEFY